MRGDIDTTTSGKTVVMHMIIDNKTMYNWMEDAKTGMMITIDTDKPETQVTGSGEIH